MTVITASLPIASLLGTRPVRVVAIGGFVLHDELSCNGPAALRGLERYRFDLAVIGAAGLSARWGVTELTDDEAEIQRAAIERAERLVVMADASKIPWSSATPQNSAAAGSISIRAATCAAAPSMAIRGWAWTANPATAAASMRSVAVP